MVLCREGLQFALDPARAVAEIRRVLRPGGRMALAVWGPRARNPWLAVVLDTVTVQLGTAVPPPGVPGPFALDDPDRLGRLLTGAGLADVVVDRVSVPLHDDSFDAWLTRTAVEQVRAGERNLGPAPVVTIAPQPVPAAGGDVDPLVVLLLGLVGGLTGGLAIAAGVAANRRHGQRTVAA